MTSRFDWERALRDAADMPWHVKSLLLLLGTFMDAQGRHARPTVATLQRCTGLSRGRVFELLKAAEEAGWLSSVTLSGKATTRVPVIPQHPSDASDPGVQPTGRDPSGTPDPYHSRIKSGSRQKSTTRASERGSRIPEPFTVTAEMIAWAREHTPLVGQAETDEFVDHWRGVPGAKGRKLDWIATWKNSMRRQQRWAEERRQPRAAARRPNADDKIRELLAPTGTNGAQILALEAPRD